MKKIKTIISVWLCSLTLFCSMIAVHAAYSFHNSTTGSWSGITVYVQEGAEFDSSTGWSWSGGTSFVSSGYALSTAVTNQYVVSASLTVPYLTRGYTVSITNSAYAIGYVYNLRNYW